MYSSNFQALRKEKCKRCMNFAFHIFTFILQTHHFFVILRRYTGITDKRQEETTMKTKKLLKVLSGMMATFMLGAFSPREDLP